MGREVILGSDHAGFALKEQLKTYLEARGFSVKDFGVSSLEPASYVEVAAAVARAVAETEGCFGILCCGTGIGMSITANKIPGVRAAACADSYTARYTRLHNDANILCLGARVLGPGFAEELADVFLGTAFEGGRHAERVGEIGDIEREK